jgi:hypothetical protein
MADFRKLHDDLATANRHMAETQARVDRQAEVARELGEARRAATEAHELLRVLQQNLDAIKVHRQQIFRELSRADRPR